MSQWQVARAKPMNTTTIASSTTGVQQQQQHDSTPDTTTASSSSPSRRDNVVTPPSSSSNVSRVTREVINAPRYSSYNLNFFDGDSEYESIRGGPSVYTQALPPEDGIGEEGTGGPTRASVLIGLQDYLSATVFQRRQQPLSLIGDEVVDGGAGVVAGAMSDEQFEREFPYERLLELDEALQARGGMCLEEVRRSLVQPSLTSSDENQCPICLDPLPINTRRRQPSTISAVTPSAAIQVVGCRHIFHRGCAEEWFLSHRTCPLCRHDPTTSQ